MKKSIVEDGKEIEEDVLKIAEDISNDLIFDFDLKKLFDDQTLRFSIENFDQFKNSKTFSHLIAFLNRKIIFAVYLFH